MGVSSGACGVCAACGVCVEWCGVCMVVNSKRDWHQTHRTHANTANSITMPQTVILASEPGSKEDPAGRQDLLYCGSGKR